MARPHDRDAAAPVQQDLADGVADLVAHVEATNDRLRCAHVAQLARQQATAQTPHAPPYAPGVAAPPDAYPDAYRATLSRSTESGAGT